MRALAGIVARLVGMETDRAFGELIQEYAGEVYQESYDADLLKRRSENLRAAQAEVRRRRERDQQLIQRLDRMGEYATQKNKKKSAK